MISPITVMPKILKNNSKLGIELKHKSLSLLVAAGNHLNLQTLEATAQRSLDYLAVVAHDLYNITLTPIIVPSKEIA